MDKVIKSGSGWRIGWNYEANRYPGLIGSDRWAVELTEEELNDFSRLLIQLVNTMETMKTELMDEEKITLEAESELMWLELDGFPNSYSLRLILYHNRCFEGNWDEGVTPDLARAVAMLKVF
jgi:hypothetical protein